MACIDNTEDLADLQPLIRTIPLPPSVTLLPLLKTIEQRASDLTTALALGKDHLSQQEQDDVDSEGVTIWNASNRWKDKGEEGKIVFARSLCSLLEVESFIVDFGNI